MALKVAYTLNGTNLTAAAAYLRISRINGGKNQLSVEVEVFETAEKAQLQGGDDPIPFRHTVGHPIANFSFSFAPDLNSEDNFLKQAYNYMKTLEQYAKAEDV